jgi:hypothetical protein
MSTDPKEQYPIIYAHRLITIGSEYYVEVDVRHAAPDYATADLLPVLSVKHGWPTDHIAFSGIPNRPAVAGGVGARLQALHAAGQQDPAKWHHDLRVVMSWMPGALRGDEPLTRDFNIRS